MVASGAGRDVGGTGVWAFVLLDRTPDWLPALRWIVLVGSVIVAVLLAVGAHRRGRATAVLAAGAILFGRGGTRGLRRRDRRDRAQRPDPTSGPAGRAGGRRRSADRAAGWPGGRLADNAALAELVKASTTVGPQRYRFDAASGLELKTGASIMAIGGFTGGDNSPTLAQFQEYVADHEIRYFIEGRTLRAARAPRLGRRAAEITDVGEGELHARDVGGTTVYDLHRAASNRADFDSWHAAAVLLSSCGLPVDKEVAMSVTDEYLKNNEEYAKNFSGPLPLPPSKHVAVVACMDARLDVYRILGLNDGEAHVIRNAGGVVTDDEIRSLAISQRLLGTKEIILIHHTDCGMLTFTDDGFKQQIQDETGLKPEWAAEAFQDLDEDVRQSIRRIEASPFVTKHESLRGFVFDVATGKLNEVTL